MLQINFNESVPVTNSKLGSVIEYYIDDDKQYNSFSYIVANYGDKIDNIELSGDELTYVNENFSFIPFGPLNKKSFIYRGDFALFILENW